MFRALRTAFALSLLFVCSLSPPVVGHAWAESLSEIKKAEWVGERPDGYLGFVKPNAPERVKKFTRDINRRRRARYREIAKKNGTDLKSVQVIIGAKLVKRAKPGEYVMNAAGKWIKK